MDAIRGTQDRPSERHDSTHSLPVENDVIARRKQTFESVAKTNHFPPELVRCEYYGGQHRVEPKTIPTAGQHANAQLHSQKRGQRSFFGSASRPAAAH